MSQFLPNKTYLNSKEAAQYFEHLTGRKSWNHYSRMLGDDFEITPGDIRPCLKNLRNVEYHRWFIQRIVNYLKENELIRIKN